MKIVGLFAVIVLLISCQNPKPRAPLNKKKSTFLISSAARNKRLLEEEELLLLQSAKNDSLHEFEKSSSGFLYAYEKKAAASVSLPKKGVKILYRYQIEYLDQNIIYDNISNLFNK